MPECDRAQHTLGIPTVIAEAVYYSDCPKLPLILVYLVVVGVIPLLWCCLMCNVIFYYLLSFFFSCWLLAGNVWIYSIYEPNYNKDTTQVSSYCNKTLYMFAFWTNNLTYILLCVMVISWCCCR